MTGDAGIAQSLLKMIPGSLSGNYKGAQPVVNVLFDRGPVANETAQPTCCGVEIDLVGSTSASSGGTFDSNNVLDQFCATDMRSACTVVQWSTGAFDINEIVLDVRLGSGSGDFYRFSIDQDIPVGGGAVDTTNSRWNVTLSGSIPLAAEVIAVHPVNGDTLEMSVVGAAIVCTHNGGTVFSVTDGTVADGSYVDVGGAGGGTVEVTDCVGEGFCP